VALDRLDDILVPLAIVALALVAARLADRFLVRRFQGMPATVTRYRVLRRSITVTIVFVGAISGLLVVPEIRAAASGILASSAILALVIGYAAQPTLSNFIAGILVAFSQPLRIGDRVDVDGSAGTVEDIWLVYTRLRSPDGARFYVPNSKLASDTIRNATLAGKEHLVRVQLPVGGSTEVGWVMKMLVDEARRAPGTLPEKAPTTFVSSIDAGGVQVTVDAWARTAEQAEAAAASLRQAAAARLREREAA
jgi:small conductance mechanosensitive channel